jgi:alpha-tubulin suppressor-like RCC1 family protein
VEGVCCNSACGTACHSCLASKTGGSNGTCAAMKDGLTCGSASGQYCSGGACTSGCSIGGAFYASGVVNPTNACQSCQPAVSSIGWTTSLNGAVCGGGAVCSAGTCQGGCWIGGSFIASGLGNPVNACQICQPSASTSAWSAVPDGTSCGSSLICATGTCQSGCYVGGVVYGSSAVNPGNACQTCNPALSTSSWYQVPSDCSVIAAHGSFTCAAINGAAKCWGSNANGGSLGAGVTIPYSAVPVLVSGLGAGVQAVSPGSDSAHSCALVNGGVKCWGWNNNGQLGNSTSIDSNLPVQVSGLTSGVLGIAIGDWHSCALLSGQVECWGDNYNQQLGSPGGGSMSTVPVAGPGGPIQAITSGSAHNCALSNGAAWCWGANFYGQLGNGSTVDSVTTVQVTGATSGVQAISAGRWHTCGIWSSSVHCWGHNGFGQLGNNSTAQSSIPVSVTGLPSGVQAIAGGLWHTCAVVNGGAWCWGYNSNGQLGNNSTTDSWVPVAVSGLGSGVQAITAGASHTCAMVSGGAKCWGSNGNGELGNNSTTESHVPVAVQGL